MKNAVIIITVIFTWTSSFSQENIQPSKKQWLEDVNFLARKLVEVHPMLYRRISKNDFDLRIKNIKKDILLQDDLGIKIRFIELVAAIKDGHTRLVPNGPFGFNYIFPVRFYQFKDGLFVTAVEKGYPQLAGAKVLEIGEVSVEEALLRISKLWNNENEYRKLEGSVFYLSYPEAMKELDIIKDIDKLNLKVRLRNGQTKKFAIKNMVRDFNMDFIYWGEMWGPNGQDVNYITGINGLPSRSYYNKDNDSLPLHLRYRSTFWMNYNVQKEYLYVQINSISDSQNETFDSFLQKIWGVLDDKKVQKFILDIRYNVGGDGSKVNKIVHSIICRPHINKSGQFFVILGRTTFSAAVMLTSSLKKHTNATFIGSPPSAFYNHCGDSEGFFLPNSKMELYVSSEWHQSYSINDQRRLIPLDVPIEFTSTDYFGKKDPILDFIVKDKYVSIRDIVLNENVNKGIEVFQERKEAFGATPWWSGISEYQWTELAYELESFGRLEEALKIHRFNLDENPKSWKACDNLGSILAKMGMNKEAIFWYNKALRLDSLNFNSNYQKKQIEKLSQE
ncbi:S41 family peptidase [Flagellimonas meishanensis]|uniref:S41 family peptidase n=1 Tax=Flagellimonas meishanensis TaxID=2873264 RepID=UPI001CA6A1A9|nr:S41 family peptidase [[Muricauda] meishanensis]